MNMTTVKAPAGSSADEIYSKAEVAIFSLFDRYYVQALCDRAEVEKVARRWIKDWYNSEEWREGIERFKELDWKTPQGNVAAELFALAMESMLLDKEFGRRPPLAAAPVSAPLPPPWAPNGIPRGGGEGAVCRHLATFVGIHNECANGGIRARQMPQFMNFLVEARNW
jgi:hypothetical protein